ncbi:hypothetical protein LOK49_LG13G02477 [Camellia lanceoleosa]|uniref:Uncharacterized protein n=1 Tax=Camellia lanceoleosa TaxID=1840588 RepID=A0ACC0FEA9_9ERIC|nr:hypothetical protein LOK49_LG13G02477 [Camellia lanceoleosa]
MFMGLESLFDLPQEIKDKYADPNQSDKYLSSSFNPLHESFRIDCAPRLEEARAFTNIMWPHENPSFCLARRSADPLLARSRRPPPNQASPASSPVDGTGDDQSPRRHRLSEEIYSPVVADPALLCVTKPSSLLCDLVLNYSTFRPHHISVCAPYRNRNRNCTAPMQIQCRFRADSEPADSEPNQTRPMQIECRFRADSELADSAESRDSEQHCTNADSERIRSRPMQTAPK